ncbi:VCBS repeat-containing protein [bacterium]|nr:VCBS repeat-containing protein [bacterium]
MNRALSFNRRVAIPLALALLAGCASGPPVRDRVQVVLHSIADGWKHRDASQVIASYDESFVARDGLGRATVDAHDVGSARTFRSQGAVDRAAFQALLAKELASFSEIEKAKFIVESFKEDKNGRIEVEVTFNLYGLTSAGARRHEISHQRLALHEKDERLTVLEHEVKDREYSEAKEPWFIDRTKEVGLAFSHEPFVAPAKSTPVIPGLYLGSGASAGDIDGDGWLDLIVGDGKKTRLLRNNGDGTFEDITDGSGLGEVGHVRGAYFFDYDNDGRLDIFLTRAKLPPRLFRNVDGLHFEDVSEKALPKDMPVGEGTSACFADLGGSGFLDIYLCNYGDFEKTGWAWPIWNATNGQKSTVLKNNGNGTFSVVDDPVLTPLGWGLAVGAGDYNDDGRPDIYVANDYGVHHLYRNDGNWKFTDVSEEAGVVDQGYGMGVAWGDYDGSGRLSLYVTNMFSSSRWAFQDPNFPLPLIAEILNLRADFQKDMLKVTHGNSLFKNVGNGKFEEVTGSANCERADWAWGANFVDYDNDGHLDIYSPNGFISGGDPADQ